MKKLWIYSITLFAICSCQYVFAGKYASQSFTYTSSQRVSFSTINGYSASEASRIMMSNIYVVGGGGGGGGGENYYGKGEGAAGGGGGAGNVSWTEGPVAYSGPYSVTIGGGGGGGASPGVNSGSDGSNGGAGGTSAIVSISSDSNWISAAGGGGGGGGDVDQSGGGLGGHGGSSAYAPGAKGEDGHWNYPASGGTGGTGVVLGGVYRGSGGSGGSGGYYYDTFPGGYRVRNYVWATNGLAGAAGYVSFVIELHDDAAPSVPDIIMSYTTAYPTFTLGTSTDTGGSGLSSRQYRIDNGSWTTYTGGSIALPNAETHTVYARALDVAGNVSAVGSVTIPKLIYIRKL